MATYLYFYFQFKEKMLYQIREEIMADNFFFFIELPMICIKKFPNVVESAGKDS